MRPRIGITTSTLRHDPAGPINPSAATHLTYARCIYHAGGLPLLLPTLPEADADEILQPLDGLLLSGGGDLDPSHWGELPHPNLGEVDPERDRFEMALLQAALRLDLPVFGICRGVQVMAVATGGDVWQDIPAQCTDSLSHQQTAERALPSHAVRIVPDSKLAQILGLDAGKSADELCLLVNSCHHQAPRNCGTVFSPVAWSVDGLVEGLALAGPAFALGVQWHPEEMADTDPRQARLFRAFIAACGG